MPRDLRIPELERGSNLPQRGALPLELALRFLPSRALALEGGLSLREDGPLLLELALYLLTRAPLLAELILHRGERRDLLLQISAQLFGLLGLLLGLSLPGSRPLEGGAVLLELGLRLDEGSLFLRQ